MFPASAGMNRSSAPPCGSRHVFPRARGGILSTQDATKSITRAAAASNARCSLRARDEPAGSAEYVGCGQVFPASAGKNRRSARYGSQTESVPRERCTDRGHLAQIIERVFPATAGMNRSWWQASLLLMRVPRERGDEPATRKFSICFPGPAMDRWRTLRKCRKGTSSLNAGLTATSQRIPYASKCSSRTLGRTDL
jgi:hypothetical protein